MTKRSVVEDGLKYLRSFDSFAWLFIPILRIKRIESVGFGIFFEESSPIPHFRP